MSDGARCSAPTPPLRSAEIDCRPPGEAWPGLIRSRWATHGLRAETTRFREQLGLPTDTPIVATGHQPTTWHAGILAKYFAADAVAARVDGHALWLVADQDAVDPFELRLPVIANDGALTTMILRLGPAPRAGMPAATLPASGATAHLKLSSPLESVAHGADRIARAYHDHRDAPNAAGQAGEATAELLEELGLHGQLLYATGLASTDLFASLVAKMREDPDGLARAYNGAVARRPHAGVGLLEISEVNHRYELPLWRIRPGMARQRVFEEDLDSIPAGELAPRALLMTALLRMAGCELFIHGSGGAQYDLVTEDWIRGWLGVELAPAALMTATLRLPLDASAPGEHDVERAIWLAHHARHDPSSLGESDPAATKLRYVKQIESLREVGDDPEPTYHEMQAFLRRYRAQHAERLDRLAVDAEELAGRAASRAVAADRTWAFALHERAALDGLREAVNDQFL